MSNHNIGFYADLTKVIFRLSSNIIRYAPCRFFLNLLLIYMTHIYACSRRLYIGVQSSLCMYICLFVLVVTSP